MTSLLEKAGKWQGMRNTAQLRRDQGAPVPVNKVRLYFCLPRASSFRPIPLEAGSPPLSVCCAHVENLRRIWRKIARQTHIANAHACMCQFPLETIDIIPSAGTGVCRCFVAAPALEGIPPPPSPPAGQPDVVIGFPDQGEFASGFPRIFGGWAFQALAVVVRRSGRHRRKTGGG